MNTHRRKRYNKRKKPKSVYDVQPTGRHIFVIILFIIAIIGLYYIAPDCITIQTSIDEYKKDEIKEIVKEVIAEMEAEEPYIDSTKEDIMTNAIATDEKQPTITSRSLTEDRQESQNKLSGYRITSYYPGDNCASGSKTGSGKSIKDFEILNINGKSVYTYKGKIVVATATEELLKSGYNVKNSGTRQSDKHYFTYYDEIKINIDGQYYDAIVLDSCGAAMWKGQYRIDIFVPTAKDVIDRHNVDVIY